MDQKLYRRSLFSLAALAALAPTFLLAEGAALTEPAPFGPLSASEISEADFLFQRRPVIVFADHPNDPSFMRQMELLPPLYPQLALRDVVLITDTDPSASSDLRKKLRPRGFSLVLMDKDWRSPLRRPSPRAAREILNMIDKMPIARTESLERNPAGR